MVAFYSQADQDIYDEGDHFIPQERYRLGKFKNTVAPMLIDSTQQVTQEFGIPNSGGAITAVTANILSGDFDITQRRGAQGKVIGMPDLRGDGEYIMKIRRFIPDFISQTGDTQISLITKNFPNDSTTTTNFTIDATDDKVDTRVRARSIALKVSNTASAQDWKLGTFRLDIQPDGRRG